jgi:hypothetical protein
LSITEADVVLVQRARLTISANIRKAKPATSISGVFTLGCLCYPDHGGAPLARSAVRKHTFHTKRLADRAAAIEKVFSEQSMERVWKKYVRPGLREQEVLDLHDFNDVHWDRKQIFAKLHNSLCSGRYNPQRSIPIRVEKRLGVTRTLVLPAPEDCIVLQCIVEAILPEALKKQPSANSFFSRSHGFDSARFTFEKDYIWFRRWAKFSSVRFEMLSTHSHICVTDIANYFDNVDYSHLRNILSLLNGIEEVTLDILFNVLDRISWRPDYLPSPERSLPQVNFDAPRLLSHVYLYEVDAFLKSASGNNFVRWVDDMTISVKSVPSGKSLLRDLDHLLMTRGLRLNAGKTQILSAAEARRFFHSGENKFLDEIKDKLSKYNNPGKQRSKLLQNIREKFDKFRAAPSYGHSEKILKRYLSHFTTTRDDHAVEFAIAMITPEPGLRENIFRYFGALGPRRDTFAAMKNYILGAHLLDDASLMEAAKTITGWHVDLNSRLHREIRSLGVKISEKSYVDRNPFYFVASLWLLAKYGMRKHIWKTIQDNLELWANSEFLARQVASTYGKFRFHKDGDKIRKQIEELRFSSASSVLLSFDRSVELTHAIRPDLRLYILNGRNVGTYSIQRFLICLHVLTCKAVDLSVRRNLRIEVLKYVIDPIYVPVINRIKI